MEEMIFVMKYYVKEGTWESVTILDGKGVEQGLADFKQSARVEEKK